MIVRKIDVNGDWTFGKGKSNYASENNAIEQKISTRLRSFLGDCFFNMGHGIDWWNILGSKRILGVSVEVGAQIVNTQGVTKLLELANRIDENRKVTLSYSASTVYSVGEPLEREVEIPNA